MTDDHASYEEFARLRRGTQEYDAGYSEATRAVEIGAAVRGRRLALGLSQADVAFRAGMTQPALSRLEAGGVVPTIPVLDRIAAALDADFILQLVPRASWSATARGASGRR
jgi:HTH-type transcriptional regulator/antitoxin HipB